MIGKRRRHYKQERQLSLKRWGASFVTSVTNQQNAVMEILFVMCKLNLLENKNTSFIQSMQTYWWRDVIGVTVIIGENEFSDLSSNLDDAVWLSPQINALWFRWVRFYDTSTIVGYLMPNPDHTYILDINEVHTISFQTFLYGHLTLS